MRHIPAIAAALLAASVPSFAAVTLEQGSIGTTSDSTSIDDYSMCDGQEEYCATLPYGGRYQSGTWALSLTNSSADFTLTLRQSSDIGGPLDWSGFELVQFIADREVRVFHRRTDSRVLGTLIPCVDCRADIFTDWSMEQLEDGRWRVTFTPDFDAHIDSGQQILSHAFSLRIAEVPEPSTWAMLVSGFGLAGTAVRRRRSIKAG